MGRVKVLPEMWIKQMMIIIWKIVKKFSYKHVEFLTVVIDWGGG